MRCPPGTVWNQNCKCCDWPFRVNFTPGKYVKSFESKIIIKENVGNKPTSTEPITTLAPGPSAGMLMAQIFSILTDAKLIIEEK